jgi:predicted dithiol-disulfide oxidoreductase (DUF899 family)
MRKLGVGGKLLLVELISYHMHLKKNRTACKSCFFGVEHVRVLLLHKNAHDTPAYVRAGCSTTVVHTMRCRAHTYDFSFRSISTKLVLHMLLLILQGGV